MSEAVVLRQRFGKRVKAALTRLNLTPADLASRCELACQDVEGILNGRRKSLTLAEMALIASCLGAPLYTFLEPGNLPPPPEAVEIVEQR
ncbi:helix-turn-helix domain-containing protein [Novosphingobium sp. KN65.2]|uniref:helix-turn-helix domain-containing protein n=1 Tax=Novosphingobium sp. KN65.2 TaxID=1478134 RepID=UPI0012E0F745|nr:helix-turn-helix domain-containing protein [Novosphingobium sp. KN65.2]